MFSAPNRWNQTDACLVLYAFCVGVWIIFAFFVSLPVESQDKQTFHTTYTSNQQTFYGLEQEATYNNQYLDVFKASTHFMQVQ